MYRRKNKTIVSKQDPANYIQGFDIYNSYLLEVLSNPSITREKYEITVYEYRPDLIAQDIYGSSSYLGLLLLQVKKDLKDLSRGTILEVIPKSVLDKIIDEI